MCALYAKGARVHEDRRHMICLEHLSYKRSFFSEIKIGKSKSWTQIVVWKRQFVVLQVCARTHRDVIMFNNACLWFFRKSKNINHNNRHIAFWNIRVAALRTRVCAYEDVAYFLDKMNLQFFLIQELNNQILDLLFKKFLPKAKSNV